MPLNSEIKKNLSKDILPLLMAVTHVIKRLNTTSLRLSRQYPRHTAIRIIRKHECGKFVSVNGLDMAKEKIVHLQFVRELFENRKCRAVIDKIYPLTEIVQANIYVDTGKKKGNVVVVISNGHKMTA